MTITKKNETQVKGRGKEIVWLEKQLHLTLGFVQIWILASISQYPRLKFKKRKRKKTSKQKYIRIPPEKDSQGERSEKLSVHSMNN